MPLVMARVVPGKHGPAIAPISDTIQTSASADEKLTRLLVAARAYRDERTQKALTDLLEAAKDIA